MVVFALLIGVLSPALIAFICFAALIFNAFILPGLSSKGLERKEDLQRGYSLGMLAYPAVLLFLSICFYSQQYFLAVGWMAMAFGDGFAGLIGRTFGGRKLPWNKNKTWTGLLAFVFFGTLGIVLITKWFEFVSVLQWSLNEEALELVKRPGVYLSNSSLLLMAFLASSVAALLESMEGWIDDNIVVPISASFIAYYFYFADFGHFLSSIQSLFLNGYLSSLVLLIFALAAVFWGKIDVKGAIAGTLIGLLLLAAEGPFALLLMAVFFVLGSLASSYQKEWKRKRKLPGSREKKRGWKNAVANAGPSAFFAILAMNLPGQSEEYLIMMAAAFAAASADTLSSELGMATGNSFYRILDWKKGKMGDNGVVSLMGFFWGFAGAFFIASFSLLIFPSVKAFVVILIAGFLGTIYDSLLGAGLENARLMNNHTVNFISCLLAGATAGLFI